MGIQSFSAASIPRRAISFAKRELLMAAFRRAVKATPPMPLDLTATGQMHALTGRNGVFEVVAAFKSLYRFASVRHPLIVHDDGSLAEQHIEFLQTHLPGTVVIRRADADRRILPVLRAAGFARLEQLRERLVFALKLIDLQVYAEGRPALYLDGDILFHQPPDLLFAMLDNAIDPWVDRYNEDVVSSYAWDPESVQRETGVELRPRINAGLVCLRRADYRNDFELFERCLALETPPELFYYVEQTLNAIGLSRSGAQPLPQQYDVCFRDTFRGEYDHWLRTAEDGHIVTSQHYCGGWLQRQHYYQHFIEHVAPTLRG